MLERVVAQIAIALFTWLEKRIEKGIVGKDATPNDLLLRTAGDNLRVWMQSRSPRK